MSQTNNDSSATSPKRLERFMHTFGPLLALAVVWVGFGLLESYLQHTAFLHSAIFTSDAISQVVQQSVVIGIAAIGMTPAYAGKVCHSCLNFAGYMG